MSSAEDRDESRIEDELRESRTLDDVQRAIEGLKDIPDDELQEFFDDDDFNIVDTWEGDEHHLEDDDRDRNPRDRDRRHSRDRSRRDRRRRSPRNRSRTRREERRREDTQRDPAKSSKDIERDKLRTKRAAETKMLAEKEKAIKYLLDSDTVVPPGTEVEAIESERLMDRSPRRSRDRRRSPERSRITPRRRSPEKRYSPIVRDRSPFNSSPDRRRRSRDCRRSSERRRRPSWDRRSSLDRRDRRASRDRSPKRNLRPPFRRTRSREPHRSRSPDRKRRMTRSPVRRPSPRRRSFSKSPDRRRKRSPFINEIARKFRDEALLTPGPAPPFIQRPALLPTPVLPIPAPSQHYLPMDPVVAMGIPAMGMPPMGIPAATFVNTFEPLPPPINFEPVIAHQLPHEYNAAPVMYNQAPRQDQFPQIPGPSPKPVPAPPKAGVKKTPAAKTKVSTATAPERVVRPPPKPSTAQNGGPERRPDRLKTPEPPVISNSKQFEKTSLSSLLEASVSARDSGCPVLYPGFKPEILRNCEMALRSLPEEDPRLKMSGRFFYNHNQEESNQSIRQLSATSILVRKTNNQILWEERHQTTDNTSAIKLRNDMYQKYTQTDNILDDKGTQTTMETMDRSVQVSPSDFPPSPPSLREEKRPVMDRLDWSGRENFDFPTNRDASDLRWSLNNSRTWSRGSPIQDRDSRTRSPERDSRAFDLSPIRSRENYSHHSKNNYISRERDRYSPRDMDIEDEYMDNRSERSREASPPRLDDCDDVEIVDETFPRDTNWGGRGRAFLTGKPRGTRGKFTSSSRGFRGRGSGYRGKF